MTDELNGEVTGKPNRVDVALAYQMRQEGQTLAAIGKHFGVSHNAIFKALKRYKPDVQPVEAPAPAPAAVEQVIHSPEEEAALEAGFWKGIRTFEAHQNCRFDVTSRGREYSLRFWRLGPNDEPELIAVDVIDHHVSVIPPDSEIFAKALAALEGEKS